MGVFWWYTGRLSGVVAAVAMLGSVAGGMSFSARNTGARFRLGLWLRAHNWLAGLAAGATVVHVVAVYLDGSYDLGLLDLAVPGITPWPLSWGVVATLLLAVGIGTSWPRRRLRSTRWRVLHLGLVVATITGAVHGFQVGTDAANQWWQAAAIGGAALLAFVIGTRVLMAVIDRMALGSRRGGFAAGDAATPMAAPRERPSDDLRESDSPGASRIDDRPRAYGAGGARTGSETRARRRARTSDRARAVALLGSTAAFIWVGSLFSSANAERASRLGSPLGRPPRGAQDFAGRQVDTLYGPVQVQARFVDGRLADVAATVAPGGNYVSEDLSAASLPVLRSEALRAQTASVDAVSGASSTSAAYEESLQSAIDKARAADATSIS